MRRNVKIIALTILIVLTIPSLCLPLSSAAEGDWEASFRVVDRYTGQGIAGMYIRFTSSLGYQYLVDASNGNEVIFHFTADQSPWSFMTLCEDYEFIQGTVNPAQYSNTLEVNPACELKGNVLDTTGEFLTGFDTKVTDKDGAVLLSTGGSYGWQVDIIYGRWLDVMPLTVTISRIGYESDSFIINTQAKELQHDFALKPVGGAPEDWASSWKVIDYFTGAAINGAKITFTPSDGTAPISIYTSNDEAVTVNFEADHSPWHYTVTVESGLYEYAEGTVDSTQDSYIIALYPARILTGTVYQISESAGYELTNYDLTVYDSQNVELQKLVGVYSCNLEVIYGRWLNLMPLTFAVSREGFDTDSFIVSDSSMLTVYHNFVLRPSGGVKEDWSSTWRVVDKFTGQSIPGASVNYSPGVGSNSFSVDVSSGQPIAVQFAADQSPWSFTVTAPGYEFASGTVDSAEDSYTIELYPARIFSGQVHDVLNNDMTNYDLTVVDSANNQVLGLGGVYSSTFEVIYGRWLNVMPLTITVSKAGYVSESFVISTDPKVDVQHDFTLRPKVNEYIIRFDYAGSPIAATITYSINNQPSVSAVTPFDLRLPAGYTLTYTYPEQITTDQSANTRYILTSSNPSSPITISEDLTISGSYKTQYWLSINTNPIGLTAPQGSNWYDSGIKITVTAADNSGYIFANWSGDSNSNNKDAAVTVAKPMTLTANYYAINGGIPAVESKGTYKDGSTIPVKFQLTDASGNYVIMEAQIVVTDSKGNIITAIASGNSNKADYFRYDSTSNQYIFNLSTKLSAMHSGETYSIFAKLSNGETINLLVVTLR